MNETNNPEIESDVTENPEVNSDDQAQDQDQIQNDNEQLIKKLTDDLEKQKDLFMRTAAEYENYRKRTQREKAAVYNDAAAATIEAILPIVDSLELALKSTNGEENDFTKGLSLIKTQLDTSFEKLGIKSIGEAGEEFDPNLHNAVMHIEDDSIADNTIVEVFQKGYSLSDRVIRHAMVKVAN